jgi:hypothetical protein
MRLADDTDVTADAPLILGPLADADEVLVSGGQLHAAGSSAEHCSNEGAHHMTRGHARLLHLPRCCTCFPQGRAA